MATFTMTLAEISEGKNALTVDEALDHPEWFGLQNYPIIEESYRRILNEKIIRRYWNREVGFETVEMFRFRMETRMLEIMPYYTQLHESTKIEFDPISTMDIKTVADNTRNTSSDGSNTTTAKGDSGSRTVSSTNPQVQLSGNGDYADSMADNKSDSSNTSEAESTATSDESSKVDSRVTGYQGLPADLLQRYRQTLINVDMMILDHLSNLFMAVTSSGSEYLNEQSPIYGFGWLGTYY